MTNKTSIRNIDPDILWDAKIYAAQTRQTMGEVFTEAIERLINDDAEDHEAEDRHHQSVKATPERLEIGSS